MLVLAKPKWRCARGLYCGNGRLSGGFVTNTLARQHGKVFFERFAGFPKIGVLSRMTPTAEAKVREIANSEVQIAIGTHALLAKSVLNHLGLLIVDEEQHFGVGEGTVGARGDIHVLTLSATPIPRTLQMALSGVREMSLLQRRH